MSPATLNRSRSPSGDRPTAGLILAILILAVLPAVSAAPAEPDQAGGDGHADRTEQAEGIMDLMRQDRWAEALPFCRAYTDSFPDDPVMLYNLACLENMTGRAEEAVAAFAEAVAAGFDDFAMAFSDPDLADVKYHPAMVNLAHEHQLRLSQLAADKAVTLSWQDISPPIHLMPAHDDSTCREPEIRLTWTPVGLDIELRVTGPGSGLAAPDNRAPWKGGAGLIITLGVSDSSDPDDYQTSNYFLFAFGMENGRILGAAYVAGQDRWQTIYELVPKIRLVGADNLELRTTIPWTSILPYNPLVDDKLGFNATLRFTGPDGLQLVSLLPDPAAFRPRSAVRRVVPLTFRTASVGKEVFVGKVSGTISSTEPVTFDLVAVSQAEGTGRLTIDFLGGPAQSLLPDGQVVETLDLVQGLNRLTRQADFTALKTGAYFIKAELTFPSGRPLAWGSTILQLAPGWQSKFLARIDRLDQQERPTALYHLNSIDQAVAAHHSRHGPGAIATTLNELDWMLENADKGGSILPDGGSFLAVYPGPTGDTRLCHIYLPSGWKIAARLNPVITLTATTGMAGAIADRMGQSYEQGRLLPTLKAGSDGGFPVFLVPRLGPPAGRRPGDLPADLEAETEACLAWAQITFKTTTILVAGVDQGAVTALRLAGTRPEAMKAMIVFAGGGLEPWPQADADFIKRQLAGFPGELPVTWANFAGETGLSGQGPLILRVLRELGSNIVEVQEVRGGLNFTQIADRTVLWAESLR